MRLRQGSLITPHNASSDGSYFVAYLGLSLVGNSWLVESGEMLGTANRIPVVVIYLAYTFQTQ